MPLPNNPLRQIQDPTRRSDEAHLSIFSASQLERSLRATQSVCDPEWIKALSQNAHLLRSRSLTILTYSLKYAPGALSLRPRIWDILRQRQKANSATVP